ncbi:hypothetical protein E2C01_045751 [Portunus trituberculatus]|uniref:Uncharacterized protein n=1 Tax=Portunus trituberculatus TaxID=210409 RepID=A0A5B7G5V3_PORTR|nr:hypothetical protein [Portunus trituberculatus]
MKKNMQTLRMTFQAPSLSSPTLHPSLPHPSLPTPPSHPPWRHLTSPRSLTSLATHPCQPFPLSQSGSRTARHTQTSRQSCEPRRVLSQSPSRL